jgi:hypothetical protein
MVKWGQGDVQEGVCAAYHQAVETIAGKGVILANPLYQECRCRNIAITAGGSVVGSSA